MMIEITHKKITQFFFNYLRDQTLKTVCQLWVLLVPEIVLKLLEEQANTISNKNRIKLVLRVLVFSFG